MLRCRKSGVLTATGRLWPRTDHRRLPPRGAVRHSLRSANVSCSLPTCSRPLSAARRWRPPCACAKSWPNSGALLQMQEMAARYGCDIAHPARTAREAVQWLYFAYMAAVKSQNGGAMSLGRTATFLDIYIERDLRAGLLNEEQAQSSLTTSS